jgi:hypothetical protein
MDVQTIQAIASLPLMGVMVWLLVREQAQKEKLLDTMIASEKVHVETLIRILAPGYRRSTDPTPPNEL